jgi:hypothetical protein
MNNNIYITHIRSLNPQISYDSDQEYRQHLRRVFRFSPEKRTYYANVKPSDIEEMNFEDLDPISKDEMELDMDALEEGMDMIFLATWEDPIFHTLYEYAAGRMFSTDPKIGQAVLCSYDTFAWYFSCVWYFISREKNVVELQEYQQLCSWFSIRSDSI